jgi:hypothetical protein
VLAFEGMTPESCQDSFRRGGEFADEDVPPADLAAVGLELDRALLRHRHGAVVVILHPGIVDDLLVVERHRHLVAAHHDPEAVPLAERLVGLDERILAGSAGGIVPQAARALRESRITLAEAESETNNSELCRIAGINA